MPKLIEHPDDLHMYKYNPYWDGDPDDEDTTQAEDDRSRAADMTEELR